MTKKELDEIIKELDLWRENRFLTKTHQKNGYIGNMLEELSEFARASKTEEKVDALCDMLVFTLNTFDIDTQAYELNKIAQAPLPASILDFVFCLSDNQLMLDENKFFGKSDDMIMYIVKTCIFNISRMGYEPYLCMKEVLKEINSRAGSYIPEMKKWVKDTSDEAKAKWYKADFTQCIKEKGQ